jgi:selenocysteine lyase/cysteine desulfurase
LPQQQAAMLFAIPDSITYLNCASLGPRLNSVKAAGHAAVERMATPWKILTPDWFADARTLRASFASLIGAPADCVALVPAVSYGIATAARNLPVAAGDNIIVVEQEYPSNFYSWRRLARARGAELRTAAAPVGASLTDAIVSAIDRHTAIVAVANCRWTNGALVDLRRVSEAARRHEAALVIDASQTIGAYPFDVAEIQPDFLVTVGYKWLLGPYGLGYMYVAERWHANGEPLEESWINRQGADDFATLVDYTDAYRQGANRFNQGASAQFFLLPMALAALAQVAQWTPAHIQERLSEWTSELSARLPALGLEALAPGERVGHMLGLTARGGLPPNLVGALAARDVYVGARGNNIRVSPHLHSTAADLERLVAALQELLA